MNFIKRYYHWLHGQWPAGLVEKLPVVGEDGQTRIPGIRIVGDLSGVPLLKFSSETGTRAIHAFLAEADYQKQRDTKDQNTYDVAIIGGGVSGYSAAMEAKKAGLSYVLIEANDSFSTIKNFPKVKPIFTYPTEMRPSGGIQYDDPRTDVKEGLLEDLLEQVRESGVETTIGHIEKVEREKGGFVLRNTADKEQSWKALRVVVAIGRSADFRKMGIPGEELDKVSNRLHDPKAFSGKDVLVVGGGDSAAEAAIALSEAGANVSVSYRKPELTRPKPENAEKLQALASEGKVDLFLPSSPISISEGSATLNHDGEEKHISNDAVFALIGRNPPLAFFRKSGLEISGERTTKWWITIVLSLLFCTWLYHWKKGIMPGWDPAGLWNWIAGLTSGLQNAANDQSSFFYTLKQSASNRSFYYSLAYCLCVSIFGYQRIKRRKTPYVTRQTITLALIQWIPLFLLPELLLPWMGRNGVFETGMGAWFAQTFFPGESYWRSYGFILAWPLAVFNWFTNEPIWGWLILGAIQTFVLIPWMIRRWGKGAYCGWICSCGALAETMGDNQRHKMPHGPKVNKLNMIGQVFLWFATLLMVFRIIGWILPDGNFFSRAFAYLANGSPLPYAENGLPVLSYNYFVDLIFAGILGVAFYFHFSGRVWCRFACPLAALMHIYARFSKFRIFADKNKCISCNVCTSVCHQGIDIMNFANKGKAMQDPECVRCSACVQQCPTGVLNFGRVGENGVPFLDTLPASPVQIRELKERRDSN
jgi:thioredoxin reductase/polyferredoxin